MIYYWLQVDVLATGMLATKHMVRVNPHLEEAEATTAELCIDKVPRFGEEVIKSRGRGEGAEDRGHRCWLCLIGQGEKVLQAWSRGGVVMSRLLTRAEVSFRNETAEGMAGLEEGNTE